MKIKITQSIRHYFGTSQSESNGIVVLSGLCLLLLALPYVYQHWFLPDINAQPSAKEIAKLDKINNQLFAADTLQQYLFEQSLSKRQDSFRRQYQSGYSKYRRPYNKKKFRKSSKRQQFKLFFFDPNTATQAQLENLGLKEYVARNIINYREKGGSFEKKADLLKIYSLKKSEYQRLKAYIQLPDSLTAKRSEQKDKKSLPKLQSFSINTADTATLRKVRGIGKVYAQRIVKYREKLGGFCCPEQLKEIWKFPPEAQETLLKYAKFDQIPYRRIKLNSASLNELQAHPYINHQLARAIIGLRSKKGKFAKVEDLKEISKINPQDFNRIAPYLVID